MLTNDATTVLPHTSENKSGNSSNTNDTLQNQELVNISQKTPIKDMPSTSFAEHMSKVKNITIPSPFKKSLFWPQPTIKKKGRMTKEKLPSAIGSKAWKEYHEKKDLDTKTKEDEKEKRKQERFEKKPENLMR